MVAAIPNDIYGFYGIHFIARKSGTYDPHQIDILRLLLLIAKPNNFSAGNVHSCEGFSADSCIKTVTRD